MQKGFSLIELMVSLVIGMIIMLGVATFIGTYTKNSSDSVARSMFESSFKGALSLMEKDIARASYWAKANEQIGKASAITDNPFKSVVVEDACILYSYDYNKNGKLEVQEHHGFYHDQGVLYYLDVPLSVQDIGEEEQPVCSTESGSYAQYWTSLVDEQTTQMDKVQFFLVEKEHVYNKVVLTERTVNVLLVGKLKAKSALPNKYTSSIKLANHAISAKL